MYSIQGPVHGKTPVTQALGPGGCRVAQASSGHPESLPLPGPARVVGPGSLEAQRLRCTSHSQVLEADTSLPWLPGGPGQSVAFWVVPFSA